MATDTVLDTFEGELPGLGKARDAQVFALVERVVLALNAVNEAHNGSAFETDEREELCAYIDESLTEHDDEKRTGAEPSSSAARPSRAGSFCDGAHARAPQARLVANAWRFYATSPELIACVGGRLHTDQRGPSSSSPTRPVAREPAHP